MVVSIKIDMFILIQRENGVLMETVKGLFSVEL
jgi:hypothetical protein